MPKRVEQHKIRDLAESIFSTFIQRKNWIIFGRQNQNDYGVDCDIQVVEEGDVSGFHFMAQLKGTEKLEKNKDGEYHFYLEKEKGLYLQKLNLPSILIVVDTEASECYWKHSFTCEENQKSFRYTFTEADNVKKAAFDSHIAEMKRISVDERSLDIVSYHKLFLELKELSQWNCDAFTGLEENEDYKIKALYFHLNDIRSTAGLVRPQILPWEYWIVRSRTMLDDFIFCFDAFYELFQYLEPLYLQALQIVKERLVRNDENSNLRYYLEELDPLDQPSKQNFFIDVQLSDENKKAINLLIENVLKAHGAKPTLDFEKKTYNNRN